MASPCATSAPSSDDRCTPRISHRQPFADAMRVTPSADVTILPETGAATGSGGPAGRWIAVPIGQVAAASVESSVVRVSRYTP